MINQEVLNFVSLIEPIYSGGVKLHIDLPTNWSSEIFALLACLADKVKVFVLEKHKMDIVEFFLVKQLLKNAIRFAIYKEIDMEVILKLFVY